MIQFHTVHVFAEDLLKKIFTRHMFENLNLSCRSMGKSSFTQYSCLYNSIRHTEILIIYETLHSQYMYVFYSLSKTVNMKLVQCSHVARAVHVKSQIVEFSYKMGLTRCTLIFGSFLKG